MAKSPYLEHILRLQDVMAAIQVMGTHQWASRPLNHWEELLGKPLSAGTWIHIFEKHPEFFGIEPSKAHGTVMFIRWRRAYPRMYDPTNFKELTVEEVEKLKAQAPSDAPELSRKPLSAEQIGTLLTIASELHTRQSAVAEQARWWMPFVISGGLGLLGVIIGALIR